MFEKEEKKMQKAKRKEMEKGVAQGSRKSKIKIHLHVVIGIQSTVPWPCVNGLRVKKARGYE